MMLHEAFVNHLDEVIAVGESVGPRGQGTMEILDKKIRIEDSRSCLIDVPSRHLNYRFAVAEWVWMMFGRSTVDELAQFNSVMRQFSDDGVWLTGAYGPHIMGQRLRVLRKLHEDPATRQAVIEIPRPGLFHTKDEPCTLSLQLLLRNGKLNLIVTMRSSDAWLGVPYDAFTFAMVQNCFAGTLGADRGWLSIRMGSAHLYDRDLPHARFVLDETDHEERDTLTMPDLPGLPPAWLEDILVKRFGASCVRSKGDLDVPPADRSWLPFGYALLAATSDEARAILRAASNVARVRASNPRRVA